MIKAWILRWLGAVSFADLNARFAAQAEQHQKLLALATADIKENIRRQHIAAMHDLHARVEVLEAEHERAMARIKQHHDEKIALLIEELNILRNSIPRVITENGTKTVRRLPSWGSFRGAVEQPRKIPVERQT